MGHRDRDCHLICPEMGPAGREKICIGEGPPRCRRRRIERRRIRSRGSVLRERDFGRWKKGLSCLVGFLSGSLEGH